MGGEVSFSIKSYIIAVHAYNNSFDTHELVRLGDDLQIWKWNIKLAFFKLKMDESYMWISIFSIGLFKTNWKNN